ncbi:hypothetical protein BW716_31495 [[Flexibacter] sp. ATCC 35208]|nr:hypothetical protein BW716_31495 [[Flexibacter] sp. ATCC 35208]
MEKGFKRYKKQLFTIGYQYHHIQEELMTNTQSNNSLMGSINCRQIILILLRTGRWSRALNE